jgi:hypothetical protein
MSQRNDRGSRVVIGLGASIGSLVLLYFSATPVLVCGPGSEYAHCTVTARALGLVEVDREQVVNVRSAALEVAAGTGTSRTPPRLVFRDSTGSRDLGYFSQRFAPDWRAVDEYVRRPNAATLRLDSPFTARTAGAYAAALVLGLLGLSTLISGLRR